MQPQKPTDSTCNDLKNMDFLSWQVHRAKAQRLDCKVTSLMSRRPRQRSGLHLN